MTAAHTSRIKEKRTGTKWLRWLKPGARAGADFSYQSLLLYPNPSRKLLDSFYLGLPAVYMVWDTATRQDQSLLLLRRARIQWMPSLDGPRNGGQCVRTPEV